MGRRGHLPQVQIDRNMAVGLNEFTLSSGSLRTKNAERIVDCGKPAGRVMHHINIETQET